MVFGMSTDRWSLGLTDSGLPPAQTAQLAGTSVRWSKTEGHGSRTEGHGSRLGAVPFGSMALHEVLCALLLRGPSHGYELQATLGAELGQLWETRASHLYLTLGRMQRDGLVVTSRQRQDNLPDRQLVRLTAAGRRSAEGWLAASSGGQDLVVRLAVARLVVPDHVERMAGVAAEDRRRALQRLRSMRRSVSEGFQPEALEFEIRRVEGELRWASMVRDTAGAIASRADAPRRRRGTEDSRLA